MANELKRKKGENEYQYLWRIDELVHAGKYSWPDVTQTVNEELYGDDVEQYKTESAHRKKCQSARAFFENGVFAFDEEEYLEKLAKQQRSIEEEKAKLRDERTSYGKQNRLMARMDETFNQLEALIKETTPYSGDTRQKDNSCTTPSNVSLIVTIADYHMGKNATNTYFGEYNSSIAKKRLDNYLSKVVEIGVRHKAENIYVVLLGDMIDGKIHFTQAVEQRENVVAQIQRASEDISWFISELAKRFRQIYVHSVAGNHSRIGKKDETLRDERLDDLIVWYAKAKLSHVENITFLNTRYDPTLIYFEVENNHVMACHGDYDGFNESDLNRMIAFTGDYPNIVLYGHKHRCAYSESGNIKMVQSGTFASSGDYEIKNRLTGSPTQAVCVVDDRDGFVFYPVKL